MSVATSTTFRLVKFLNQLELSLFVAGDYHLGNPFSGIDDEVLLRQVDEHDTHLATVISINGTRSVQNGKTVLQRQTATGTYLSLVALG